MSIRYCEFLKERLKNILLEKSLDFDVDSEEIENIRNWIFTLDDIKENFSEIK